MYLNTVSIPLRHWSNSDCASSTKSRKLSRAQPGRGASPAISAHAVQCEAADSEVDGYGRRRHGMRRGSRHGHRRLAERNRERSSRRCPWRGAAAQQPRCRAAAAAAAAGGIRRPVRRRRGAAGGGAAARVSLLQQWLRRLRPTAVGHMHRCPSLRRGGLAPARLRRGGSGGGAALHRDDALVALARRGRTRRTLIATRRPCRRCRGGAHAASRDGVLPPPRRAFGQAVRRRALAKWHDVRGAVARSCPGPGPGPCSLM